MNKITHSITEHARVYASRIVVVPGSGGLDVHIEFKCPNCGLQHTMIEHFVRYLIETDSPGWMLSCGWVEVQLPWPSVLIGPDDLP